MTCFLKELQTGWFSALDDPHSMILSGEKYESFMQSTRGEYGGIGVVIGADRKNVTRIISVFPGSSAEKKWFTVRRYY